VSEQKLTNASPTSLSPLMMTFVRLIASDRLWGFLWLFWNEVRCYKIGSQWIMFVCMHVYMYVSMYVCMYLCMYVCRYVCMHVLVHLANETTVFALCLIWMQTESSSCSLSEWVGCKIRKTVACEMSFLTF
jgi:type IV secretory pathway VirB3-like protein